MSNELLIIFLRNPEPGKVKTRLAAKVGDEKALEVYLNLLDHTLEVTKKVNCDKAVFYSEFIDKNDDWDNFLFRKFLQDGKDLGERMNNAFKKGFEMGYTSISIIGSDCYELTAPIIKRAFQKLHKNEVVIGPSLDGGYYLLGMNSLHDVLFENKEWSTPKVFKQTLDDIVKFNIKAALLPMLNDLDDVKDLARFEKQIKEKRKIVV